MSIQEFISLFPKSQLSREERGVIDNAIQWIEQFSELEVVDGLKNIHPSVLTLGRIHLDWCDVPAAEEEEFGEWSRIETIGVGTTNVGGVQAYFAHTYDPNSVDHDSYRIFADNPAVLAQMGYDVQVIKHGRVVEIEHYMAKTKAAPAPQPKAEQAPTAPPVTSRRTLAIASRAPLEGDMEQVDGVWWYCTGTGKIWQMGDNSHGDSSLEGEWVCYAYYIPATEGQIAVQLEKQAQAEKARLWKESLSRLTTTIKQNGYRADSAQGEKVMDTRPYYNGAGYGVGDVWYMTEDTVTIAHYTGSDVPEWEWQYHASSLPAHVDALAHLVAQLKD